MAKTVYDPAGIPVEMGNSTGRPRTKFDKIVRQVMPFYDPEDPGWVKDVPLNVRTMIGDACGGPMMRNWEKVVEAFVSAGLSQEDADAIVSRGYSSIYSPWKYSDEG